MPVILTLTSEKDWLRTDIKSHDVIELLKPYPAKEMVYYPISTLVDKPSNNCMDVIKPGRILNNIWKTL